MPTWRRVPHASRNESSTLHGPEKGRSVTILCAFSGSGQSLLILATFDDDDGQLLHMIRYSTLCPL